MVNKEELWQRYFDDNTIENRNALIIAYQGLVYSIAMNVIKKYRHKSLPEVVSDGQIGLMKAIASFDPTKGKFNPFAARRIHGAIIDSHRSDDFLTRSLRKENAVRHRPIEEAESLEYTQKPMPELRDDVNFILSNMDKKLAKVLTLNILKSKSLEEIAPIVGVSSSMVCRLMSKALLCAKAIAKRLYE